MSQQDAWSIPASGETCNRCDGPLAAGDMVTTVLHLAAEGPRREDLCATCGEMGESGEGAIFWRRRKPDDDEQKLVVDYTMLREIFGHLLQRPEEQYQRLSYLIGLVLLRKRLLRLKGFEVRDGAEVMVVTRGVGQPEILVPAPHLDAEQLVETREQLSRLLNSELPDDLDLTAVAPEEPSAS